MVVSDKLRNRLVNWKFESALDYLEGETDEVVELVTALANTFGNIGWIDGNMGIIISQALASIGIKEEEEDY